MSARSLGTSPLTVIVIALSAIGAWTFAYETNAESAPAVDHGEPVVLREATSKKPARGGPDDIPVVRTGPMLRYAPDLDEQPFGMPIAIEDRDGRSLSRFKAAIERTAKGEGQTRVIFYGASHVASDLFTGQIRRALQTRYGDGGAGFVLPVHPWRSYRQLDVQIESNREVWSSARIRANSTEVDRYGLAGIYVETNRAAAWGKVSTSSRGLGSAAGRYDLYYLRQPGGGDVDVYIDGKRVERVRTAAETFAPGYATFDVADGPHEFEVRTIGTGMVRLYGVTVEREVPGVIVDSLGLNGARANSHLLWEDSMYREHLARRQPDLVVLAYGTNESGDSLPMEQYEEQLTQVVQRIREVVPHASCLLVGPSDRPLQVDNAYHQRPRTADVIEVQHRVAVRNGCGFFDLVAFQGGPMSMMEWASASPAYGAADHIHYTRLGYYRLGDLLLEAMMEGVPGFPTQPAGKQGDSAVAKASRSDEAGGG